MEGMEFRLPWPLESPWVPYRESLSEFKRKTPRKDSECPEDPFLEAARLAPSSTNSQPWYFIRSGNKVHVYCRSLNRLTGMFYEKFNRMDVGIACCHIWLAGLRPRERPGFHERPQIRASHPGYEYILTVSGI